ncbi:hypothetical protein [Myroides guanonis]|uniref:Uncharacterized protein n=1 Tax=Myroides guanonis TaxID=1150112 RepID=A0A1I3R498_9FLAO|nr:hypothetical protein [Myroides guanonis]SFJ41443.1 hypothetical protein SAMN04487893_10753 [Myroides guanonis]
MKFTIIIQRETSIQIKGNKVLLIFKNGPTEEMQIGEAVETATWTDNHNLLITLKDGGVRLYSDTINFEKI